MLGAPPIHTLMNVVHMRSSDQVRHSSPVGLGPSWTLVLKHWITIRKNLLFGEKMPTGSSALHWRDVQSHIVIHFMRQPKTLYCKTEMRAHTVPKYFESLYWSTEALNNQQKENHCERCKENHVQVDQHVNKKKISRISLLHLRMSLRLLVPSPTN